MWRKETLDSMTKAAHHAPRYVQKAVAILLLHAHMAFAGEPLSAEFSAPSPTMPAQSGQLAFHETMRRSLNPLDAYRSDIVPPPSMSNSKRLSDVVRDGKLYLSLSDAINLALENNLDLVIARYNLPIAQTDVQRTAAGGILRGVNTGVVTGTPGGGAGGAGAGTGAGGTSAGAGGAGAGSAGIVSSTLGTGVVVPEFDPQISATGYVDHTAELPTTLFGGANLYRHNSVYGDFGYTQNFSTGTSFQLDWVSQRRTTNGTFDFLSPALTTRMAVTVTQQLLAGFGLGPNLRFLRIARTDQKISDIAFRAQVIATVTQICDIYWDLVSAYDDEQVRERSVAFATDTLNTSRKQLELQAIPAMDVLKAESDLAVRQQDLTVARTNLELQELYMKNAITRALDDPVLQEMPVVPTDRIATQIQPMTEPVQDMIAAALQNRTELQETNLDLQNRVLSRQSARNALLPSLSVYGIFVGTGLAGQRSPNFNANAFGVTLPVPAVPGDYNGALQTVFANNAPDYQVGFKLNIPLRNRIAKADQYRTELEYR
jgi:outer membrane protein TolC